MRSILYGIRILIPEASHKPISDLRGPAVGVDPRDELANTSVDTGEVGTSASLTPGDDADEDTGRVDNGAARVTLAGITAAAVDTSAEHGRGDVAAVLAVAGGAGDNGDRDLAEGGDDGAVLAGVAPAGDGGAAAGGRVGAGGGQADVADATAGLDGAGQAPEGDVVVQGLAVVAGVDDDLSDANLGATRGPLLMVWLVCS